MDSQYVEVFIPKDNIEAQFVRGQLEAAGIKVQLTGENLQGLAGEIPTGHSTAPSLWVSKQEAEKARAIIKEHENNQK